MLELDIVKIKTNTPDIYGVGYAEIFKQIKRVDIHSILMQDFDKSMIVASVGWKAREDLEFAKTLPFVEDMMPIGALAGELSYIVNAKLPSVYHRFLVNFITNSALFIEFPLTLMENEVTGYVVGAPDKIKEFAEFATSIGMHYEIVSKRKYLPGLKGIASGLTQQQARCVKAAVDEGFFDSPRKKGSREIAGTIGISHVTFLEHLRKSERIIFEQIFGE